MDPLSELLASLRISSSILSQGDFSAPWAVQTKPLGDPVFHAVVTGTAWVHREGDADAQPLEAGEIVVLPRGDGHVMSSAPNLPPISIADVPARRSGNVALVEFGGGGAATRIICGTFRLQHIAADSLLSLLPPLLRVGRDNPHGRWIEVTLGMLEQELRGTQAGADATVTRLTDILFVHVLRSHVSELAPGTRGLLGALRDAQIARAVALIHRTPDQRWTLNLMAREVGLSRSVFSARFTELVGAPFTQHLTRWRMQSAADAISLDASLSTMELAERVGYQSEDAFVRAFRRHMGCTPAKYRRAAG
jgi:AraC-like DNA-binding protein